MTFYMASLTFHVLSIHLKSTLKITSYSIFRSVMRDSGVSPSVEYQAPLESPSVSIDYNSQEDKVIERMMSWKRSGAAEIIQLDLL